MNDTETTFSPCHTPTLVAQIGRMNVLAISGGRVQHRETGVTLPVGSGYSVTVDYDGGSDTYTVRRVFVRAGRTWVKGEQTWVHAEEVGESAYQASSFRSNPFGGHDPYERGGEEL